MDLGLKGKVALVAGASQGMGRATALGFAREGAKVAICARGEAALNHAAEMIRGRTGGEVLAMVADMSTPEDIKKFVNDSAKHFGRVDVIINNALSPALVAAPFGIANAIVTEAGLSLLGFGVRPPTPTWGTLLKLGSANYNYWWLVVVPSVAIREGVQKTLDLTAGHFAGLYQSQPVDWWTYDSKQVSRLRGFALSNELQILIMRWSKFRSLVTVKTSRFLNGFGGCIDLFDDFNCFDGVFCFEQTTLAV